MKHPRFTNIPQLPEVYTFVQSYSAELVPQGNFTLNTTAPSGYILQVHEPLALEKVNNVDFSTVNIDGSVTNVSVSGNAYEGNIIWSMGMGFTDAQLSSLEPAQFHVEYNNLYNLYTTHSLFAGQRSITFNNLVYNLTAIRFPQLKVSGSIGITNNTRLTEINFNELEYVVGGGFLGISLGTSIGGYGSTGNPLLKEVNFPKLKYVEGLVGIGGYSLTVPNSLSSVNLPNLEYCSSSLIFGNDLTNIAGTLRYYHNLQTINIPKLTDCGGVILGYLPSIEIFEPQSLKKLRGEVKVIECSALRQVNLPELEYVIGGYAFQVTIAGITTNTSSLTSISIPKLKYWRPPSGVNYTSTAGLCSLELGTNTLKFFGFSSTNSSSFICDQRLLQTSVDNILKMFARLDGTNGTVSFTGQVSLAGNNQPPSYTGGVTTTSLGSNFVRTGNTVAVQLDGHGHETGDIVTFTGNTISGLNGTYVVTKMDDDNFQYTTPTSSNITGGGTVTMRRTTVATDGFRYLQTIVLRGGTVTANITNL